jgi:hypothetical protein
VCDSHRVTGFRRNGPTSLFPGHCRRPRSDKGVRKRDLTRSTTLEHNLLIVSGNSIAMRKFLLIGGLAATLVGCRHDSKVRPVSQEQPASAPASSQTTESVAQPTAPITATVPPNDPAAPSSGKQNPPTQQFATQAPPSQGQQNPPPQQLAGETPQAFPPAPPVIPAGTRVHVRLEQTIDTKRNRSGDRFRASLTSPIAMNGELLVPAGTTFEGHVTVAQPSGRFKGRAQLGLELDSFRLDGVDYRVVTAPAMRVSGRHRKRNWILIGGGAGFGTAVGAIAGGPPGALIGAGAGAGAGAVGAFFTGRKNVSLAVETPLTFRFQSGVELAGG